MTLAASPAPSPRCPHCGESVDREPELHTVDQMVEKVVSALRNKGRE